MGALWGPWALGPQRGLRTGTSPVCVLARAQVWRLCGSHIRLAAVVQQHNWGCSTATRSVAVAKQHICGCETCQESAGKHGNGHEWGREGSVWTETLSHPSCAPQDASPMPRLSKRHELPLPTKKHQNKLKNVFGKFSVPGPRVLFIGPISVRCRVPTAIPPG